MVKFSRRRGAADGCRRRQAGAPTRGSGWPARCRATGTTGRAVTGAAWPARPGRGVTGAARADAPW